MMFRFAPQIRDKKLNGKSFYVNLVAIKWCHGFVLVIKVARSSQRVHPRRPL